MPEQVRWQGAKPERCDLCGEPLGSAQFVDGKTRMGPWAIMCISCHLVDGVGLGLGRGQKFDGFTLNKVEG